MKGKKIDSNFLSSFIEECVLQNKNTTEAILQEAKQKIEIIDKKIIEAESLKLLRSKLLDVIHTFDVPQNTSKNNDAKALPLFKISNPNICKHICNKIKVGPMKISSIDDKFPKIDVMFCVKQLLETKVLIRTGDLLSKGDMFSTYMKLVLCSNDK
jgi:hypothetical protein